MVARSSEYFSTAPAVRSAAAASSSPAPSTCRALAQLIASAMPGGLARSRWRSRATPAATWSASESAAAGTRRLVSAAARDIWVIDPVVEASPLQRVVQVAGPVRGEDDDRRIVSPPRPEFGNRNRRLGEQLEQERLELVVAPV